MTGLKLDIRTSDPELKELCELYWQRDGQGEYRFRVGELARRFDIPTHLVAATVAANSVAVAAEQICSRCGQSRLVTSRADFQSLRGRTSSFWSCADCREADRLARERMRLEADRVEAERLASRREEVRSFFGERIPARCGLTELTLGQAVSLLALVRAAGDEELESAGPVRGCEPPFGPSLDCELKLLRALWDSGRIDVHPDSPIEAFVWEEEEPRRLYLDSVAWRLPGGTAAATRPLIEDIEAAFRDFDWPDHWWNEVDDLWRDLALYEAIAYLELCMSDHHLEARVGEKTELVLRSALESFSLGQVYNFIWRAAKDAAAYYMRADIPKQRAANSVVGAIQRSAERAVASGWDIKPFRRDWRLPESHGSATFFRAALQLDEPLNELVPASLPD